MIVARLESTTRDIRHFVGCWLRSLEERSRRLVAFLDLRMEWLIFGWLIVFTMAAMPRVMFPVSPIHSFLDFAQIVLPYGVIALAPIMGYRLAADSFPRGRISTQPAFRFALVGRWHKLDPDTARRDPAYGPVGFMASLLIGILLNVPVRTFEFLISVPAMNSNAPAWGTTIFHVMAFDVVAMNFLYMVCFVMALRSIPLFPRMLLYTWVTDLAMQFVIAHSVVSAPNLPPTVANALHRLLEDNLTKVFISMAVWLPYLLLSRRVNVTYRQRISTGHWNGTQD